MKRLITILSLVIGFVISGSGYAQSFHETSTISAKPANENKDPSVSFVNHSHAELEITFIHSGIFSSVNNLQKSGTGFIAILSCSLAHSFFKNTISPIPAKGILPLYPDYIYPFHSFW